MKKMLEVKTAVGVARVVIEDRQIDSYIDLLKEMSGGRKKICYEVFDALNMPLEKLPEDVQLKVKEVLKCYDRCSVVHEYREFNVSVGTAIKKHYNHDHFVCGYYHAADVYTEEERRQNYIEAFGGR